MPDADALAFPLLAQNQAPSAPAPGPPADPGGPAGDGGTAQTTAPGGPGTTGPPPGDSGGGGLLGNPLILMLLIMVVMFVFLGSGNRKQKKRRAEMLASLAKGDRIQTVGGILGTIVELREDEAVVKVDENTNARMRFARTAIQAKLEDKKPEEVEPAK